MRDFNENRKDQYVLVLSCYCNYFDLV